MPPIKNLHEMTQDEKLDLLIILMMGNPMNANDKGFIGDIAWLKTNVVKLNRIKDRTAAWIAGAGAVGAIVASAVFFIINYLKK